LTQVLLTGPLDSGKTDVCKKLFQLARTAGLVVGGVSVERQMDEDEKTEVLTLRDLTSGSYCVLARPSSEGDPPEGWFQEGNWNFHQEAFMWANVIMSKPVPLDMVIIDEITPLEIEQGGLSPAAWTIRSPRVLYVARSGLASQIKPLAARGEFLIVELTEENREDIPRKICTLLDIGD